MNRTGRVCFWLFSWIVGLWTTPVWAHEPGLSSATIRVQPTTLEVEVVFAPIDLQWLLPITLRSGSRWTAENFESARPKLEEIGREAWKITTAENVSRRLTSTVAFEPANNNVVFHAAYSRPSRGEVKVQSLWLAGLPPGHRQYLTLFDAQGVTLLEKLLNARESEVGFSMPEGEGMSLAPPARTLTFLGFVRLGIEHILTGYDHLLFLFGLLVVCRRVKSILAIITCFTIAHSITLALAALQIVSIPSSIVEPLIAASIVFVGVENLLRREDPRARKTLTFLFGLIHGFGFATALRELGLGTTGKDLLVPLFSFNLGVEIGQISVAAMVLPLLWWLRQTPSFTRRWMPALSTVVASAGLYWLLQRAILG